MCTNMLRVLNISQPKEERILCKILIFDDGSDLGKCIGLRTFQHFLVHNMQKCIKYVAKNNLYKIVVQKAQRLKSKFIL